MRRPSLIVLLFLVLLVGAMGASSSLAATQPLGDGDVTARGALSKNTMRLCGARQTRPRLASRPWINQQKRTWNKQRKPANNGAVPWIGARFNIISGKRTRFQGNGLPVKTRTGAFPAGDDSASYLPDAAALHAHQVQGAFPQRPKRRKKPACVAAGRPIAVALNGIFIYPSHNRQGYDLVAREVRDASCSGVTNSKGLYYYRGSVPCLTRGESARRHSRQIGWARDGYALFGPRNQRGRVLTNKRLDACHGHTHLTRLRGKLVRRYHYHQTRRSPYLIGCFRATPSRTWSATRVLDEPDEPEDPVTLTPDPPARPAVIQVSLSSTLVPSFQPTVSDYVTRCNDQAVQATVSMPLGTSASIDGDAFTDTARDKTIPLASGQAFSFVIRSDQDQTYRVRCLPNDFPVWEFDRLATPSQEWYLTAPSLAGGGRPYVAMFDGYGVPVWWYRTQGYSPLDAKILDDGRLAFARYLGGSFATNPEAQYEFYDFNGTQTGSLKTVDSPTDHHDIQELDNGNFMLITYRPRSSRVDLRPYGGPDQATVIDSEIQELTPQGVLVWSWNSSDYIDLAETGRWYDYQVLASPTPLTGGVSGYDITHINSVDIQESLVVISLRHTDAVYGIDRTTKEVIWKIGGTSTEKSLEIVNDPRAPNPLGGQHDARILSDGSISIHDNATGLGRGPRAVQYRLALDEGRAYMTREQTDNEIPASGCCGSARTLDSGGWLTGWGGTGLTSEFDVDGNRVFRLNFPNIATYRTYPVAYNRVSRASLIAGMNQMHPR